LVFANRANPQTDPIAQAKFLISIFNHVTTLVVKLESAKRRTRHEKEPAASLVLSTKAACWLPHLPRTLKSLRKRRLAKDQ
jgi:hypothetical protein